MAGTEVANAYVSILPKSGGNFKSVAQNATNQMGNTFKSGLSAIGVAAGNLLANALSSTIGNIGQLLSESLSYSDALTRFPLVLESLGVAGDQAAVSIERLRAGLEGTPILVSDATTAVQRLVATTGDVQKSTDWFIALNDAVMAGGAPFQVQQAAIEQWQQAVAKGKPDRIEFRSFMQAFPGVMKQVGIKLGKTTAELQNMFSKGELSMEEFNSVLLELDKNGVEGFKNLKEQARQALVGIDTGFGLVKKSIIEAFGSLFLKINISKQMGLFQDIGKKLGSTITNAFTPAAEQLGFALGKLVDRISKSGSGLEEASKKVGEYFGWLFYNINEGAGKAFANLFTPLIRDLKIIIGYIAQLVLKFTEFAAKNQQLFKIAGEVIAKFIEFKIITGLITKLGAAFGGTSLIFGAKAALIIGAIGAIIAAFSHLYNTDEEFKQQMDEIGAKISDAFSSIAEKAQEIWQSLQPIFDMIVKAFLDIIKTVGPSIGNMFADILSSIAPVLQTINDAIVALTPVLQQILGVATKIIESVVNALAKILPPLLSLIEPLLDAILGVLVELSPVIGDIVEIIGEVVSVLAEFLGEILPPIISIISNILKALSPILQVLAMLLNTILKPIIDLLGVILVPILKVVANILISLANFISLLVNIIATVITFIVEFINACGEVANTIWDTFVGAFNEAGENIGKFIEDVLQWFRDLPGNIVNAIGDLGGLLWDKGRELIQGLIDGIKSMAKDFWDAITGFFGGVGEFFSNIFTDVKMPEMPQLQAGVYRMRLNAQTSVNELLGTMTAGLTLNTPYTPNKQAFAYAQAGQPTQIINYNTYFNNTRVNDTPAIREAVLQVNKVTSRRAQM